MLEDKRNELHEKAYNLAFHYYIRSGQVPPLVAAITSVTSSKTAFETAMRKYSADQPRVPAGNGRESGQWTSGGSGDTTTMPPVPIASATSSPIPDASLFTAPQPRKDPGATPVVLNDGSIVTNPITGKPLLMPKNVSLSDNAAIGVKLGLLPSMFTPGITVPIPALGINSLPAREVGMIALFAPGNLMDYQRTYSNDGMINRNYINFGNYNYGVVAAAAGYDLNQALFASGLANLWGRGDHSGPMYNNPSNIVWIEKGFSDYANGLIGGQ